MKKLQRLLTSIIACTLLLCFCLTGCGKQEDKKYDAAVVDCVEQWSTWDLKGYYFKNVQVIGTPKICEEYPIVEITVSFELEEITAGGYKLYELGKIYQVTNRCFYENCTVNWTQENNDGTLEDKSYDYQQYAYLQEYDWEKCYWNKNLTISEIDSDNAEINEQLADFIESNNQKKRDKEK